MDAEFFNSSDWACRRPVYDEKGGSVHERVVIATRDNVDTIFTQQRDDGYFEKPNDKTEILDSTKSFITNPNGNTLIRYVGTNEVVELPDTIRFIGEEAFMYRDDITSVAAKNLTQVGNYAFAECKNLKAFPFGNLTSIGDAAFEDCFALEKVVFANSVAIGYGAFFACEKLEEVVFNGDVSKINYAAFGRCYELREVIFEQNCHVICNNAFEKCGKLKNFIEPSGLESLGYFAFRKCKELGEFTIPTSMSPNGLTREEAKELQNGGRIRKHGMGNDVFFGCNNVNIRIRKAASADWPQNWNDGHTPQLI